MRSERATTLRVGIFVVTSLTLAAILVFIIGDQRNLFKPKVDYYAEFDTVGGLRKGSPIRIAGFDVGTVRSVRIREDGKVVVGLAVSQDSTPLIRTRSLATIGSKGLLGDKLVDIISQPDANGHKGELIPAGGRIPSQAPTELAAYFAKAGPLLDKLDTTVANLERATATFGEPAFSQDVRDTTHHLAEIMRMAAREDGTVRRLFADQQMADSIEATVHNTRAMTQELAQTARSIRTLVAEVERGDGLAHELVYGESGRQLATNLADLSGETALMLREVRTGSGLAHDLIYEDRGGELLDNLNAMSADLRAITAEVRAGRGTLGGLLSDPSLYEDVKRLVGNLERNEILRALVRYSIRRDEARPQAIVREAGE